MSTLINPLESRRTINGKHCRVFLPGNRFLTWLESFEARPVLERADINVSGRFQTGYKLVGASGTGTLNGFHVNSAIRRMVAIAFSTGRMPPPTYLVSEMSDPDQYGRGPGGAGAAAVERLALLQVNFWEAPLGWETGDVVRDDIPFTFEDILWPEEDMIPDPTELQPFLNA